MKVAFLFFSKMEYLSSKRQLYKSKKRTTTSNDTLLALNNFKMFESIFDCYNLFWR